MQKAANAAVFEIYWAFKLNFTPIFGTNRKTFSKKKDFFHYTQSHNRETVKIKFKGSCSTISPQTF